MKGLLLSMLLAAAALSANPAPVTIELSDDYSKTKHSVKRQSCSQRSRAAATFR